MNVSIGILAHVDAGKTTLSEQILYRFGAIRKPGRVDHGDTVLDHDAAEQKRGITIYTDQASFCIGSNTYYLLDTPGHTDFCAEMERALRALDYAVLVVSCVEGVQAHTEIIWTLLREYGIPTFFFLNKTDREGADISRTMQQIRTRLSPNAFVLDDGLEANAQTLAELDEVLLDAYCDTGFDDALWRARTCVCILERLCFPCFSGSALTGDGVQRFLEQLNTLVRTDYSVELPFSAVVYKVRYDPSGNRVSYLKILSGVLRTKDMPAGEKIHEIRTYCGGKYETVSEARAGQLCAVTGLTVPAGTVFGQTDPVPAPKNAALLSAAVCFPASVPVQNVMDAFRVLEAEEPQMAVEYRPAVQQIHIRVMGPIQLEILREQCSARFGLDVDFAPPEILYQETIASTVYGCGHFEPLRHYAEVHILLRPLPRGTGIRFSSECPTDVLRLNWQRLIETHVFEKTHRGALCGFPLTDVEVVLLNGRAHEKHTEGGDFRQALYRAVRHALFHAEGVLLEPFYRFTIRVPSSNIGRILSDLEKMSADYDPPLSDGDDMSVAGRCPVSEMLNYASELSAFTKGRGVLRVRFDGYDLCHDPEAVLAAHPYDREADVENTADSVFCSHGAGYTVNWREAAKKMHCFVDAGKLIAKN